MAKKPARTKRVYFFGKTKTEGKKEMKVLLGGKGANLAEMTRAGLPVPPGFTITTAVCNDYLARGGRFPDGLRPSTSTEWIRYTIAYYDAE